MPPAATAYASRYMHSACTSVCLYIRAALSTVYFKFPISHSNPDITGGTECYVHCRWRTVAIELDPFLFFIYRDE